MFRFHQTQCDLRCVILHVQLRHLITATSKNDVFYYSGMSVEHWNPLTGITKPAISFFSPELFRFRCSTLAAFDNLLLCGGFDGQFVVKRLDASNDPVRIGTITTDLDSITNHFHMLENSKCIISSNDKRLRILDLNTLSFSATFATDWSVNCAARSPDKAMVCAVGDSIDSLLLDATSGKVLDTLKGHRDYSFACAWSPCGTFLCTGNQDKTTRIYDIRRTDRVLSVLQGKMAAIRSLSFSGPQLVMAEAADFVHVIDIATDTSQVIDFFGEIGGITIHSDNLFIANGDDNIGCIMQFRKTNTVCDLEALV